MLTFDQIRAPVERVVLLALAYAAGRGWISEADVAGFGVAALAAISAFYGWWINRPKAVVQAAAAIPGTTVVTTPELAAATSETNIVSNGEEK